MRWSSRGWFLLAVDVFHSFVPNSIKATAGLLEHDPGFVWLMLTTSLAERCNLAIFKYFYMSIFCFSFVVSWSIPRLLPLLFLFSWHFLCCMDRVASSWLLEPPVAKMSCRKWKCWMLSAPRSMYPTLQQGNSWWKLWRWETIKGWQITSRLAGNEWFCSRSAFWNTVQLNYNFSELLVHM